MNSVTDVTLLISTIATSIGTLFGIWLSIYNIRSKIGQNFTFTVNEHQRLINPQRGYHADRSYTSVRVINTGSRPLRVSSVGYQYLNMTGGGVFSESIQNSHQELPVDGVRDYLADETGRGDSRIAYYYASSVTGKTKKRYMTPRLLVWGRDVLHFLRLWRKSAVPSNRTEQ